MIIWLIFSADLLLADLSTMDLVWENEKNQIQSVKMEEFEGTQINLQKKHYNEKKT